MNAILFVGDSTIVFKKGARVHARKDRNLLLTLGFDVYGQPPETTAPVVEKDEQSALIG